MNSLTIHLPDFSRLVSNTVSNKVQPFHCWIDFKEIYHQQPSHDIQTHLTHWGLVMPYGDTDLGQHWPR